MQKSGLAPHSRGYGQQHLSDLVGKVTAGARGRTKWNRWVAVATFSRSELPSPDRLPGDSSWGNDRSRQEPSVAAGELWSGAIRSVILELHYPYHTELQRTSESDNGFAVIGLSPFLAHAVLTSARATKRFRRTRSVLTDVTFPCADQVEPSL